MRRRIGVVLFCGWAVLVEGCRRGASEDDAPVVRPDANGAALTRVTHVCHLFQGGPAERRSACCGGPPRGHLGSECERELSLALGAGRIELDETKIQACAEASERALAGCDWVTPGQPMPPSECEGLTRGRVGLGGTCKSSLECQAPLHCEGSTPSQGGRCAEPKADGAACGPPADALATYLFARDLERLHPGCAGQCSLVTHRCEPATREQQMAQQPAAQQPIAKQSPAAAQQPAAKARSAAGSDKLPGEPCMTDFECRVGGCSGVPGRCGMKCAVSFADTARFPALHPLELPRRSPRK